VRRIMAKKDKIQGVVEKALGLLHGDYERVRAAEREELHNAIVDIIAEHNMPVESILGVLDVVRFQLKMAKWKEIMGVVKLTDKPPVKATK